MKAQTKPKAPPKEKGSGQGHRPRLDDRERQPLPDIVYDEGGGTILG